MDSYLEKENKTLMKVVEFHTSLILISKYIVYYVKDWGKGVTKVAKLQTTLMYSKLIYNILEGECSYWFWVEKKG